jgi:hypothetical protein
MIFSRWLDIKQKLSKYQNLLYYKKHRNQDKLQITKQHYNKIFLKKNGSRKIFKNHRKKR